MTQPYPWHERFLRMLLPRHEDKPILIGDYNPELLLIQWIPFLSFKAV